MRLLVIGAGPAGMRCAERVAQRIPGARILLAGAEPALPYDRIALGRLLAREVEADALLTHDRQRLTDLGIRFLPGTRIASLDPHGRIAISARGETFEFDRAVFATGSDAVRLKLPGADLPGVFVYRTMADVLGMRRAISPGSRAVVIGGGLLGLEAAASLSSIGARVTVVHATDWPMERQLDATAGALLARQLGAGRGLRFAMPASCEAIEGPDRVEALRLANGTRIACELVVMAVGVRLSVELARAAGLAVERGILVDEAMRTSHPDILGVGECAQVNGRVCGLVAPALAMAETAAATLAGAEALHAASADAAALKVAGIQVWSAGRIAPDGAEAITLADEEAGSYRRLWLHEGRLVGAVLYGETDDAGFYLDLIASGRPVAPMRARLAFGSSFAEAA